MSETRSQRPFVLLNMSMTADGKIATENRAVESFSSPRDQAHLLELRAETDAVLCGARTVNGAGVTLGPGGVAYQRLRRRRGLAPFNLRVVVTGRARLRPDADVFRDPISPVILLVSRAAPDRRLRALRRVATDIGIFGRERVDLRAALEWLADAWSVRRLVCEGGAELNDAMFRAQLIDEVHLTLCPKLIGGRRAPTLAEGSGAQTLGGATPLALERIRRVGNELFLTYRVVRDPS